MGTLVEIIGVDVDQALLAVAQEMTLDLEALWSRFLPSSEVSRMNAFAGRPVVVSENTFTLVSLAVQGWHLTGGLFDPTLLNHLIAAGYDRSFEHLQPDGAPMSSMPADAPTAGAILLDPGIPAVTLPAGAAFDPGGIGKGLAADMIAADMISRDLLGICVNIGGDLRIEGEPPGEWTIDVEDPFGSDPVARLRLSAGAVATSSVTRRVWMSAGQRRHHIIDPRTRRPADARIASASVVAGEAWLAEVLAKAALLCGEIDEAFSLLAEHAACGLLVDMAGRVCLSPGMRDFLA